jgi:MoxR-like ATPase
MQPQEVADRIRTEVLRFVVGKEDVVEHMLEALIAGGHVLLEGPPGVGKTTLAKSFAFAIGGEFKRIQLTPDLLPADVLGTSVYDLKSQEFVTRFGPVFANVVMADELNRATPRTQSAFLEAMQERQVTIDLKSHPLPQPFMVIATQIPTGGAGTYPLTETQVDRFAMKLDMGIPTRSEETTIITRADEIENQVAKPQVSSEQLFSISSAAASVRVSDSVKDYIISLVEGARAVKGLSVPVSPRASIWLFRLSRASALLQGRTFVIPDDVKALVVPVMEHRLLLAYESQALSTRPRDVLTSIIETVTVPKE